jgi:hypothetical protein
VGLHGAAGDQLDIGDRLGVGDAAGGVGAADAQHVPQEFGQARISALRGDVAGFQFGDELELCGVVAAHAGFEVVEGVHQFGVVLLPDFPPHLSDSTTPAPKGNGARGEKPWGRRAGRK